METQEEWKDIKGYEGIYQISNFGNVKSLERTAKTRYPGITYTIKEKIRKITYNESGYALVVLSKDGKNKTFLVHRLVADAFVNNPDKDVFTLVNHKDENKHNNCCDNLEWCTATYNNTYRNIHLRRNLDSINRKIIQYDLDMNEIKRWDSVVQASTYYKIASANIIKCCKSERSHCAGFKWRYYD